MPNELSTVKVPERIVNNKHQDWIRWTALSESGAEVGKWGRTACYSGIMGNLGSYEIHCRPYWKRSDAYEHDASRMDVADKAEDAKRRDEATNLLPGGLYKDFWKFCKETGLVPEEAKAFVENKQNRLAIPCQGWDRHTVYTTLSLYRHCDCQPRMAATAVLLYRKLRRQGVHFLQCLHYAMSDLNHPNHGHVFIIMAENSGCYGGNYGARNLAASLAMARFARMPMEERKGLGNGMTYSMFCNMAKDLNPTRSESASANYHSPRIANGVGHPRYVLKNKDSVLLPKFAPLYENSDLTPEEFAEAMKGECEAGS